MKIKKITIILLIITAVVLTFGIADITNAQTLKDAGKQLTNVGKAAYGTDVVKPLPELVGKYIRIFLGLLGVIFVILMVYGGYTWMTSFGAQEKVKKAKDLIIDAVIGLIIILAAYVLTNYVVSALVKQTIT